MQDRRPFPIHQIQHCARTLHHCALNLGAAVAAAVSKQRAISSGVSKMASSYGMSQLHH